LSGQFKDPIRIVAFNTLEHWAEDVSEEVANEIRTRCDIEGISVPEHIGDFVASHSGQTQQLSIALHEASPDRDIRRKAST
jgi:hypothetical protein